MLSGQPGRTAGPGWPNTCQQYPFVAGRVLAVHKPSDIGHEHLLPPNGRSARPATEWPESLMTGPEYSESEVVAAAPTSKSGKTQFPLGPPRTDLRGGADCTVKR